MEAQNERTMDRVILYEEYRLIERSDNEINGAWKGVHIILFFLAFLFGCSCTFSFHILMYMFDEKCVLFPKLLSLREMRETVIYEFMPVKNEDSLPVDFVSTQWTESSTCYLPTYVPLVSGIFGLVWTTMYLMCSSGNRTMTGLQRPWRILLPVFVFSVAMGSLSVYTSYVTHSGLQDLCEKLSEVTGSKTCAYTVNIVTLAYERRIRGVYQATRLTILTAWMHTLCWLLAAAVALTRVLLVIDFRLVRIQAELQGNIEQMLEHHEQHIRTISPEVLVKDGTTSTRPDTAAASTEMSNLNVEPSVIITMADDTLPSHSKHQTASSESVKVRFLNKTYRSDSETRIDIDESHYISQRKESRSVSSSLVPIEAQKLAKLKELRSVARHNRFIAKIVFNLLDRIDYSSSSMDSSSLSSFESLKKLKTQTGASFILPAKEYPPSYPQATTDTSLRNTSDVPSDQEYLVSSPKVPTEKRSSQGLSIADSQDKRLSRKQQTKDADQDNISKDLNKELTKRLNTMKGLRSGAIIIPHHPSTPKPRKGSGRPRVTKSARLAPRISSRSVKSKTSSSTETAVDASEVLENEIARVRYTPARIDSKKSAVQTDPVPSKDSPLTLQPDSVDRLKYYSPSEKTLTPEVLDELVSRYSYQEDKVDKLDRTPSKLSQRTKVRLPDDQRPEPSKSRDKSHSESQTDYKKEKQD